MNESFGMSRRSIKHQKSKNNISDLNNSDSMNKSINEEDNKNNTSGMDFNQSYNFGNSSILITDRTDVSNVIREIKEDEDLEFQKLNSEGNLGIADAIEEEDSDDELESFDMEISKIFLYFLYLFIYFLLF